MCFVHTSITAILTHWGWVTHICVDNLTLIGLDNGLLPCQCQAIIWTNAGILLIRPLGTNLSEILIEIYTFSFKKMHLKVSSPKWRSFCLGLNVLKKSPGDIMLTRWSLYNMATMSQTTFSCSFSCMKSIVFWFKFHWNLFPNGPINNMPGLVQIMAWHQSCAKPLSEPMMVQFTDVYMQHSASRSKCLNPIPWLTPDERQSVKTTSKRPTEISFSVMEHYIWIQLSWGI